VLLASRRGRERTGEVLTSGLLSGFVYPVTRLELIDGEMLCELQNPWPTGRWTGRWSDRSRELMNRRGCRQLEPGPGASNPFWMSIQDFCQHFTDIAEARVLPASWQASAVTCSSERPSYPLLSAPTSMQAVFELSQADRRWGPQAAYRVAIGLRIYRCRVVAPAPHVVGARQNVSSPFKNLELIAERAPTKARSVVVEISKLEPDCLYIAAVDAEPCELPFAVLRVLTAATPRFRELSAPETSYFLHSQATAAPVVDRDSFSSQGSVEMGSGLIGSPLQEAEALRAVGSPIPLDMGGWQEWSEESSDHLLLAVPNFLKACMTACTTGKC